MAQTIAAQSDEDAVVQSWLRRAPVSRRILAHIGLQGKLIACFMGMLLVGFAARYWLFLRVSREVSAMVRPCLNVDAALHRAEIAMIVCNLLGALVAIPIVMVIVHRIFEPIRSLVTATNRIAAGDLEARVAIHRPDAIGTLARAFNRMARQVRQQQKDLEEANRRLAATNHQLEEKVQQRTAQLEAANKRLKVEIAEKEDFLLAISHDLSAPLRNISGMASMLLHKKRNVFDQEVIHRLERIQKNVEVESDLIGELLELSKIKSTRHRMIKIDLNDLVQDIAGTFEGDLHSRGITLRVDGQLPTLRCERARIRQVFQNLIDNAIKYMGDSGSAFAPSPAVSEERAGVRGHSREQRNSANCPSAQPSPPSTAEREPKKEIRIGAMTRDDEVEFYVQDTGMGIEEEDVETIFYIFRRGRNAAVRTIAGKGVGLACVKSIIETYDGSIRVESKPGRGSTFSFTINGKYVVESQELVGTL